MWYQMTHRAPKALPFHAVAAWACVLLAGWCFSQGPPETKSPERAGDPPTSATDCYGDALPAGSLARLGTLRLWHPGGAQALAVSPDGRTLATSSAALVCLWDRATGRQLQPPFIHRTSVLSVAFSRDGKTLFTVSQDNVVRSWQVLTGREVSSFSVKDLEIRSWAWSLHAEQLALAGIGVIQAWEVPSGKLCSRIQTRPGTIRAFGLSPDGKKIAYSVDRDNVVEVWDLTSNMPLQQFSGTAKGLTAVAFSNAGDMLASGSHWGTVCIWDLMTGNIKFTIKSHEGPIRSLKFIPDDEGLILHGGNYSICHHDLSARREPRRFLTSPSGILAFALSHDGRTLAATSFSGGIHQWGLADAREQPLFDRHDGRISAVAFGPDRSTVVSASDDLTVRVWNTRSGKVIRRFATPNRIVPLGLRFVAEDRIGALGIRAGVTEIFEVRTPETRQQFGRENAWTCAPTVSPDGRLLAAGTTESIVRDGDLGHRGRIDLWDVASGKALRSFGQCANWVQSLAFSPEGALLASANRDGTIAVWTVGSGRRIQEMQLPVHQELVSTLCFSRDGRTLASGSDWPHVLNDCTIRLWDVLTGEERQRFRGHPGPIKDIVLSPDGTTLASASMDRTVRVWDIASGEELQRFTGHEGPVDRVAFSGDGMVLASGSVDTTILLWDVSKSSLRKNSGRVEFDEAQIRAAWKDLGSREGPRVHRAIWKMVRAGKTVLPFLAQHVTPREFVPEQKIATLVAELDSKEFLRRQSASAELLRLGEIAEGTLRRALEGSPSLEARRRMEEIVAELEKQTLAAERLGPLRAIEVLEQIGTAEARRILESVGQGTPQVRLTQDARAAVARLRR